ncbi:flagellar basal body L-ring protein FlgH [Pseudotabrizicola algicola]|uniref:Flagellar L-ring protein n=1 Tax=Pseudotabrizicola algicola TaxID=2709381 RepID=A0A6B3RIK8_9RHOB|nr:flagellar basal body L-ring protein FlgH [Pseudotabrizicola algicola]NEX45251.1 flagellar basal body L-ring protein FlgH [Pseudotabrizicola algicola]
MTHVLRLALLLPLAACSTYIEDTASLDYAPIHTEAQPFAPTVTGGIYHQGARGLFVNDRRATAVGDVLTVEFSERFQATKTQSSNAAKSSSMEMELPGLLVGDFDNAKLGGSTQQSFSGRGGAAQSNSFTGRLSVSVVRVLPNGHLEIMGQKRLTLNNGNEYVRLTGIVRPEDIGPDNVVSSDRVAHADIRYTGAGGTADTARRGWLSRAVDVVNPL